MEGADLKASTQICSTINSAVKMTAQCTCVVALVQFGEGASGGWISAIGFWCGEKVRLVVAKDPCSTHSVETARPRPTLGRRFMGSRFAK